MSTATIQLQVRRSRFSRHLLAAVAHALPAGLRPWLLQTSRPQPASDSAAREAQEVRSLAYSYSRTDPGFASDLYAAAARHEGLHGN